MVIGRLKYRQDLDKTGSSSDVVTEYILKHSAESIPRTLDFLFTDISDEAGDANLTAFFTNPSPLKNRVSFSNDCGQFWGLVLVVFPEYGHIRYTLSSRELYSNAHIIDVDPLIVTGTNPSISLDPSSSGTHISILDPRKAHRTHNTSNVPGKIIGGIFCKKNLFKDYRDQAWLADTYKT